MNCRGMDWSRAGAEGNRRDSTLHTTMRARIMDDSFRDEGIRISDRRARRVPSTMAVHQRSQDTCLNLHTASDHVAAGWSNFVFIRAAKTFF